MRWHSWALTNGAGWSALAAFDMTGQWQFVVAALALFAGGLASAWGD